MKLQGSGLRSAAGLLETNMALSGFSENDLGTAAGINSDTKMKDPTCPNGLCLNPKTNDVYKFGDECKPDELKTLGCNMCTEVIECQFTK